MSSKQSLEESGLLIKGVSEAIKNEAKEQKGGFLGMLLDTLGASSLGTGKGTIKASEDTVRADQDFLPPHPLKNFERQRYYEKEPKFNGVY